MAKSFAFLLLFACFQPGYLFGVRRRRQFTLKASNMSDLQKEGLPNIDEVSSVAKTKWLELQTLTYTDEVGKQRKWDYVKRTTKPESAEADGIVIIPLLKSKDGRIDTVLVEQYRPPVGCRTMEFPAGLIDEGETVEQAALRELREETGYVGEFCKTVPTVSRTVCMSPGLTDESVKIVTVTVDLENPYNQNPRAQLDDGEYIVTKQVSLNDALQTLLEQGSSMPIEGLYMFALGLELGKTLNSK